MSKQLINRFNSYEVDQFKKELEAMQVGNALNKYQRISSQSAFYPGQGTALGLAYVALKLNGEAGEFAEHVGKAMRDDTLIPIDYSNSPKPFGVAHLDPNGLTPERRAALIKEAGDILWYLGAVCRELNITLAECATANLDKLVDRDKRKVLQGSGDER